MGQTFGVYLNEPNTECESLNGSCDYLSYGASTMQGWRKKQEDAFNCIPNFDTNTSLFAVYDGHGGKEVAIYCKKNLPRIVKQHLEDNSNVSEALRDAFIECDMCIQEPEGKEELKSILNKYDTTEDKVFARNISIVEALFKSSTSSKDNATSSKKSLEVEKGQNLNNESSSKSLNGKAVPDNYCETNDEMKSSGASSSKSLNGKAVPDNNCETNDEMKSSGASSSKSLNGKAVPDNYFETNDEMKSSGESSSKSLNGKAVPDTYCETNDEMKSSGDSHQEINVKQTSHVAAKKKIIEIMLSDDSSDEFDISEVAPIVQAKKNIFEIVLSDDEITFTHNITRVNDAKDDARSSKKSCEVEKGQNLNNDSCQEIIDVEKAPIVKEKTVEVIDLTLSDNSDLASGSEPSSPSKSLFERNSDSILLNKDNMEQELSQPDKDSDLASGTEPCSPSKSLFESNLDSIILNKDNMEQELSQPDKESQANLVLYDPENVTDPDVLYTDNEDSDYDPEKEVMNLKFSEAEETNDLSEEFDDLSEESDESQLSNDENDDIPKPNEFLRILEDEKCEPAYSSGSTAVVAIIRENILYVANAGDSRCVLCRNGNAIDMSVDHKPEDPKECERITKAGGDVCDEGRINSGLNLSRALGDGMYKNANDLGIDEQMVICIPDVKKIQLTENDDFIILASDGIWNCMSSQDVVDYIKIRMNNVDSTLSQICEEIFYHCLATNTKGDGTGCDNMTLIIVNLRKNCEASDSSKKRTLEECEFNEPKKARSE